MNKSNPERGKSIGYTGAPQNRAARKAAGHDVTPFNGMQVTRSTKKPEPKKPQDGCDDPRVIAQVREAMAPKPCVVAARPEGNSVMF